MKDAKEYILTLSCRDATGIVHAVSGLLYQAGCNIVESQQFGDVEDDDATGRFFMRVHFAAPPQLSDTATLVALFGHVRQQFDMALHFHARNVRPRVMLMVSQHGHCLNDLLFRVRSNQMAIDVPCVVSNHTTHAELVRGHGMAFHHLPLAPGADASAKQAQEQRVLELVRNERIDLVVLARYMQILSAEFVERYQHRIINIHHSFLPAFSGGRPYQQAHERGVKLIGATAHYATKDLDEGPIIEQDVIRASHRDTVDELVRKGADVERNVLSRAVRWHLDDRVLVYGNKTVVFS
jgi:formyltetrahydrofolate deformylase